MKPATLTFGTAHRTVLTAEDGGGPEHENVGGRPRGLASTRPSVAGAWEWMNLQPEDDDHVSLWSANGYALCAEADEHQHIRGIAVFNRKSVGPWERWRVVRVGSGIALEAFDGESFLVAESDGKIKVRKPGPPDLNPEGEPGAWETFQPSAMDWLEEAPVPVTPRIVGQLRIANGNFIDNNGPVLPVFCHAGDLIGQGLVLGLDHILPALDDIAAATYNGLRSWWTVWPPGPNTFWDSKPAPRWDITRPESREAGIVILKAGAARGLVWHLAAGGLDAWTTNECNAKFDILAEIIAAVGSDRIAYCEGVNEARDTAGPHANPAAIEGFIQRIRSRFPQMLYALSAYTGHEDRDVLKAWTPSWMPLYVVHGWRGGVVRDKVRHIFSLGYPGEATAVRWNGWQGEPTGPGHFVSATSSQGELDDESLALMAAMSMMARQAWNYMSSPGVIYHHRPEDTFPQMLGFMSVPKMVHAMPMDVMSYRTLAHGGESWRNERILAAQGDVRCDFTKSTDGRFVTIVYGPSGSYDIEVSKSFEGEIIHPGTGERSPISGHAGNRVRIEFKYGRIIIGKLT